MDKIPTCIGFSDRFGAKVNRGTLYRTLLGRHVQGDELFRRQIYIKRIALNHAITASEERLAAWAAGGRGAI